ncbi:MAG: branched-chain amino acid ABC transporter permease [Firmicutes bacterium HGW-Firmicutes-1]|jgi:branched-chain amino acid transport system permease protein|nr:MAG: branched-chain amino acid ABC transporter permease [Firmicutes bacterium HGW-Firmicutes-1]
MKDFLQQIIYGINAGSIYALIALGYTMVYGIVKLINFAHGDILMMGAYFGLLAMTVFGIPFPIAIILAMILCATFGMLVERVAYRPLRNAPRISALITALGISMFLESYFAVQFGLEVRKMPEIPWLVGTTMIGGISIPKVTFLIVGLSILCMVGLQFIVKKTKVGKAMRAVSEDMQAAKLMGINVNKTISFTFALGSGLGALGGVLYSVAYYQVEPYMGILPGLKAFVAAVLGGIGIIPGAMFGGFVMGIIENLTKGFISSSWSNAILFGILILVLLFKPSGIFGKNTREKV